MYSPTSEPKRNDRTERRLTAALRAVLPNSAMLKVSVVDQSHDATIRIGSCRLAVRWVGRGGLREVRDVLRSRPRPDVIVGSELSAAARAAARDAALGWVDETGAAEIVSGNIVVSRSGERPRGTTRPKRWTPSVLGVAEAVLCGVTPTASATAEATGHSMSSTAHALSMLTELGLLAAPASRGRNSGRRVIDADRLLDEYADAAARLRPKAELRCGNLWQEPFVALEKIGECWDRAGIAWAATGVMGASVLAPYMTEVTNGEVCVDARSGPELLTIARLADIEPLDGGRLVLRPFPTATSVRLATEMDGIRIAPWPRVFADLRQVGVRGEEAAEHLREVIRGR
ncbi:MAG: hypothetical protein ACYCV7_04325 [Acidimicrobiales bacterium]